MAALVASSAYRARRRSRRRRRRRAQHVRVHPGGDRGVDRRGARAGGGVEARSRGRRLVVAGCMPSRYGADLRRGDARGRRVRCRWPTRTSVLRVLEELARRAAGREARVHRARPARPTAYLKVSEGCDRRCAYCTIPAIRGPFVSRPLERDRSTRPRLLIAGGARELVLVGQDIAATAATSPMPARTSPTLVRAPRRARGRLPHPPDVPAARRRHRPAARGHRRQPPRLPLPRHPAAARLARPCSTRWGAPASRGRHLALLERIRAALPDVDAAHHA